MIRILTTLALGVGLAVASPGIAVADPTPTPPPSSSAVTTSPDDHRVGGTPGAPEPPAPGWAWWVGAAMVVAFGAGGVRLWRNRETEDERWTDDAHWPDGERLADEQRWNEDSSWAGERSD